MPVSTIVAGKARTGPDGQRGDGAVHQPSGWSTFTSQVASHPPSPLFDITSQLPPSGNKGYNSNREVFIDVLVVAPDVHFVD